MDGKLNIHLLTINIVFRFIFRKFNGFIQVNFKDIDENDKLSVRK